MSQATFRSLFIGRPARVGLLLVVIATWALAVVGPAAAQEDTPPSAPAELPAAPVGTPICGPTQNVGGAIATNDDELAAKIDPTGSRLGDAVEAVGRAVMAWNQRFDADPSATPWRVAAKVTVGHMLMPNPPRITFWPSG
mgnify:CR=1 FL=1